ncbi:hypothetical protein B0H14DRAFT_2614264 [Mycena olivaceomarginata]|nr:hypothetical protein B0H14DRAFT_2614264 [Mycena olivaceomarginata]
MGAPKADVQRNLDLAALLFRTVKFGRGVTMCNIIIADVLLQEGNALAAKTLIKESLQSLLEHHTIVSYCLARLSDMTHWDALPGMSHWPTVFLAHSLKSKQKLGIYKALQSIGDVMLAQNDKHTAITLFRLALEGFTEMDVHCSRAECMLRMGDFCQHTTAFLRQLNIGTQRGHCLRDVLEQHRNNLVHLAILNVPAVLPDDLSVAGSGGLSGNFSLMDQDITIQVAGSVWTHPLNTELLGTLVNEAEKQKKGEYEWGTDKGEIRWSEEAQPQLQPLPLCTLPCLLSHTSNKFHLLCQQPAT